MGLNFENLDWAAGQVAIPGVYHKVYYIPKNDIDVWPTLSAAPASAADEVTYAGAFTLVALKTWKLINCIDVKTSVGGENQGEIRSKTFLNKASIATGMTGEEATALAKLSNNTDLLFLVQEKNSAKWRLIGNEMFNTECKPSLNLGGEPTSERGLMLEVECSDPIPLPFYDGAIVTDDGDVNPA